jgi:hypothetical protein
LAKIIVTQYSDHRDEVTTSMNLSARPLTALLIKAFTRTFVKAEGQFHLGTLDQSGLAVLTRINSVVARRVRVKSFADLSGATIGKRVKLANNQSTKITISHNEHIFGTPTLRVTWFQGLRRFETDLKVYNIGVF